MPSKKNKNLPRHVHVRKDGKWEVRVTYIDDSGKRRSIAEVVAIKDLDAIAKRAGEMRDSIHRKRVGAPMHSIPITFASIARRFAELEFQPAVFRDGKKVAGRKSIKTLKSQLEMLVREFGYRNPQTISYSELKTFKLKRLNTEVVMYSVVKPRSIATVNREMALLKQVLNYAFRERWVDRNPFHAGPSLILLADETPRTTLWSEDEEHAALQLCVGRRSHLRPFIVMITHGGFRSSELTQLEWSQVDFAANVIRLKSEQTKSNKARNVPMHKEVVKELKALRKQNKGKFVFGGIKRVSTAWHSIRKQIGRTDLQLRDLRSVAGSRLAKAGVSILTTSRILGHSNTKITERHYIVTGDDTLQEGIDKL